MDNNNSKQTEETDKNEVKRNVKQTYGSIRTFLHELLDIREDTDRDSTMEAILKDIPFKGHTAWILIFSIIVASVGLNVSSTAVVIGAMLISPLMGPIVGLGFSVAINDIDTLRRSLVNLGVMVGLSLLTAFLYFKLSPLTELTPELEARTYPTILDVLVAIFGGLALIIAKTKKGTIITVISGVAIATALMPPLCTAGYGLAVWNLSYFGGAMYLFTINTIFIALSTFVVSKLLKFPLVKYANSIRRKRIAQIASTIAIIVMIPSIYLFYNLLKESYFEQDAKRFVEQELMEYPDAFIQKNATVYNYNSGTEPEIEVSFLGKEIPEPVIKLWKNKLSSYSALEGTKLKILQNENSESFNQMKYIMELKTRDSLEIINKEKEILALKQQMEEIKASVRYVPFGDIAKEIKLNYGDVESVKYAELLSTDFNKLDTIPYFKITWKTALDVEQRKDFETRLANWLAFKINQNQVKVDIIAEEKFETTESNLN
jgi:uncharacterized hydrophobic protein (TIGR00271 family)